MTLGRDDAGTRPGPRTDQRSPRLVAGPGGSFENTIESFRSAIGTPANTVEMDVIWLRDAHLPLERRAPLVVAHDWADAERRAPLALTEALDAFLEPPLDRIEINIDVKLPGREEEIVLALKERDLTDRAMISTMEMYTLDRIGRLEPELRRGWSYPKVTRDWREVRWARLPMFAALQAMRHRLPGLAAEKLPKLGVSSMWVYHPLVSPRLGRICELAGVELIAWKVNDARRMRELLAGGASGICTSEPSELESL